MKKKYTKEFVIGASAVLAILILLFGIDYLKGINIFKAANYYYVSYTDVAGLTQSAPVTLNGYKVGLVREIGYEYDNPGHVLVELSLDKKLQITEGTEAVLVTDMLGTSSIELHMNPTSKVHKIGDHLKGVQSTGLMQSLSGDLLPGVSGLMPKIDSLLTAVTTIATDPALASSLKRMDNIMANLETTTQRLNQAMASLPSVTSDAKVTMDNVKTITGNLTTVTEDLGKVSGELRDAPLDSMLVNVYQLSESLKEITAQLNTKDSSLGLLINDPSFYNNLNASVASLDSLLIDVKRNPKRYISIKLL
ncbi:MAG: MCE family protein [Bacteroidales bacterium]|nr:MCE family protein [Bacteroidales bacterium]